MMKQHAVLFEPLQLGPVTLRNCVIHAPLSVCYADERGFATERMAAHYGRRAMGGAAMVIVEGIAVNTAGRQLPRQALLSTPEHIPGLRAVAAEIKRHGAVAVLQIAHAGRYAGPWERYEERRRLAPSPVAFSLAPDRVVTPQEMTPSEIAETVEAFWAATKLAREAGFEGVEIHGAQGLLISSFQSRRMNVRDDGYGRQPSRLALEVVDAVVDAARGEMVVGYHLFADELIPGGWGLPDACDFVQRLEGRGVDFLIPILTTFESLRDPSNRALLAREGYQHGAAAAIQKATDIPVLLNGNLGNPDLAAAVVAAGDSAAVALGRPLLADPDWVIKVRSGRAANIRGCACAPALCLQTQLTGVRCGAWPSHIQDTGFLGYGA